MSIFNLSRHLARGATPVLKTCEQRLSTTAAAWRGKGVIPRQQPLMNHEHAILIEDPEIVAWNYRRENTTEDFEWTGKTFTQLAAFWAFPFTVLWAICSQEDNPAPFPKYTCRGCRLKHTCEMCEANGTRCQLHVYEDEPRPKPMPQSTIHHMDNGDGQKIVWDGFLRCNLNLYDPIVPKKGTDRQCVEHCPYPDDLWDK